MPDWFQLETISSNVLSRLDTVGALCMVGRVNKELRRVVRENVWLWRYAVECTCGTQLPSDSHAAVETWVCPWRTMPRRVSFRIEMFRLYDVFGLRFEGESTLVVTFLLRHTLGQDIVRMDAEVCLNSFTVRYGEAVGLNVDAYSVVISARGLASLDLHGSDMELEVPEEILCSCNGRMADIRRASIHNGAFALYSGGDNTSDVYVFSTGGRLLRRIHVPRSVQEIMVSCKAGCMAILHFGYDTADVWLSLYIPLVK